MFTRKNLKQTLEGNHVYILSVCKGVCESELSEKCPKTKFLKSLRIFPYMLHMYMFTKKQRNMFDGYPSVFVCGIHLLSLHPDLDIKVKTTEADTDT